MYHIIKNFCDRKGITILKMCKELEIKPQIITNLKRRTATGKKAGLSAENAAKIADFMGISVTELIKG